MVKHTVLVQMTGATPLQAEVELDTDALGLETPPPRSTGSLRLGSYGRLAATRSVSFFCGLRAFGFLVLAVAVQHWLTKGNITFTPEFLVDAGVLLISLPLDGTFDVCPSYSNDIRAQLLWNGNYVG